MSSNVNVVAVIPARGGSKRFPRKNIAPLLGVPLVNYTIVSALKSQLISRVILSTDCKEIAEIARKAGAEVPFMRPRDLALDTTGSPEVVEHALKYLEETEAYRPDVVVLLQPTSPLRNEEHISQCVSMFIVNSSFDTMVSVVENDYPPELLYQISDGYLVPYWKNGEKYFHARRQDFEKNYKHNGAIWITRNSYFRKVRRLVGGRIGYFVMDKTASLDIDTEQDMEIIEALMRGRDSVRSG